MSCHRAVREQRDVRPIHPRQKRMERDARGQWFGFYLSIHLCLCIHDPLQFYLNEFVLLFANHENGTRCRADYTFRCAANGEMFPTREAVGGDDDKIDIQIFGGLAYLVRCVASADYRVDGGESPGANPTR